jgi:hypothetical protein
MARNELLFDFGAEEDRTKEWKSLSGFAITNATERRNFAHTVKFKAVLAHRGGDSD